MARVREKLRSASLYVVTFLKWAILATITGAVGGLIGTAFHKTVEAATELRSENTWVIMLLPLGGLVIAGMYKLAKINEDKGTNLIISSVRGTDKVPLAVAPLIFVSTAITHLLGGSAGREGAALQLGGSIGSQVGKIFKLNEKDMSLIIMSGMSGVFSALFGTPLTAVFFAMEVISVGVIYYSGFIPCIISSLVAYKVSMMFHVSPVRFTLENTPGFCAESVIKVSILAALCAVVSIVFCVTMKQTAKLLTKYLKNSFVRIAIGGLIIIILTYIIGNQNYNGAGMNIVSKAIGGDANWYDFILKIVFTAITIGAGFKGGEIVPTMFIGTTFGCVAAQLIGIDAGFGAAIGLIAVFCGVVNCPVASVFLSIELFGAEGLILFAVASGISYMLSGYYGLYSSQKIMYSKLRPEYINKNAK